MRLVLVLVTGLLVPGIGHADMQTVSNQRTTPPANARFEIMQSELTTQETFRLDRFTGQVAKLMKSTDADDMWADMHVIQLPKISNAVRPRFQLFTSGLTVRDTFLIDTDTGKTWRVVTGKERGADGVEYEVHVWQPFAN